MRHVVSTCVDRRLRKDAPTLRCPKSILRDFEKEMTQNDAKDTLAKRGMFVKKITHTNRLYAIFFDKPVSFILSIVYPFRRYH